MWFLLSKGILEVPTIYCGAGTRYQRSLLLKHCIANEKHAKGNETKHLFLEGTTTCTKNLKVLTAQESNSEHGE